MKMLPTLAHLEVRPCALDSAYLAICRVSGYGPATVLAFVRYDQAMELLVSLLDSLEGAPNVQQPTYKTSSWLLRGEGTKGSRRLF